MAVVRGVGPTGWLQGGGELTQNLKEPHSLLSSVLT